jgi:hypothetical protein
MIFFYKISSIFDEKKEAGTGGAGAAISNFGPGSRRQFILVPWLSAPAPQH